MPEVSQASVALVAEQPTDIPGHIIMIDVKTTLVAFLPNRASTGGLADRTLSPL